MKLIKTEDAVGHVLCHERKKLIGLLHLCH